MTMAGNAGGVVRTFAKRAREIVQPQHLLALRTVVETTPRPDSRVLLDSRTDALGQPCAMVDWRVSDSDRRGLDRLRRTLAEAFARQGLGQMVDDWSLNETGWPPSMEGGRHHMGTTRMHPDPHRGVVDENGRVHGVANLFVAGSSVFPTGSYVNPTLTIVALTHRLADHLAGALASKSRLRLSRSDITAVIVNHNGGEQITAAIAHLRRQSPRPDALIVVDNGSTDGSAGNGGRFRRRRPGHRAGPEPGPGHRPQSRHAGGHDGFGSAGRRRCLPGPGLHRQAACGTSTIPPLRSPCRGSCSIPRTS